MLKKVRRIIASARNRESFFEIIASIYPTLDSRYKIIEDAYQDAKDAFRGRNRDGGERYFEHLRAVTLILILYLRETDHRLIAAELLHDIVEDIPGWTIERVKGKYGEEIAGWVERMTKPDKKDWRESLNIYHARFKYADRKFFYLKLADRLHNLLTLGECAAEKIKRKVEETKLFYLPFAEEHFILIHEMEAAIELLEKNLGKNKKRAKKI